MTKYTETKFVYEREAANAYGTSVITAAADTAYFMGAVSERSKGPSPRYRVNYVGPDVNTSETPSGGASKGRYTANGFLGVTLQNGVPLEWIMGKSSTAGADPYTHTITTPTDGSALPSFTMQQERTGTATDWAIQYTGVKVANMSLHISAEIPRLLALMDVVGQDAADPGWVLTSNPALPATANTDTYRFNAMTRTWDYGEATAVALDGLSQMSLNINAGLSPWYAETWSGATYTGNKPEGYNEARRRAYSCHMLLHPSTVEDDLWDESIATSNTKELYFKWTRDTNDYIEATLTNCQVVYYEPDVPIDTHIMDEVIIEPESITFTVKDSIVGDRYGE